MMQTDMKCVKCGLPIGRGSMGTTIPLCQCQWNAEDFKRPEDHESLYSRLIAELSATKEKLEAAERRIRESHDQKHVGLFFRGEISGLCCAVEKSGGIYSKDIFPLYTMPPIPPELAELQRENAELRKQLGSLNYLHH